MPTYSYACTACAHRFDTVQAFTDPALTECPECAGRLRKLFAPVGVVFKGSGFYRTDSRAGGSGKSADGKSADGKAAEGKAAEGKPAADGKSTAGKSTDGAGAAKSTAKSPPATSSAA